MLKSVNLLKIFFRFRCFMIDKQEKTTNFTILSGFDLYCNQILN
jgi:hypothetical protein